MTSRSPCRAGAWFTVLLAALLLSGAWGCPAVDRAPVQTRCVKQYEKCKLPSGPLGVCDVIECKPGNVAPCFKCMPQH